MLFNSSIKRGRIRNIGPHKSIKNLSFREVSVLKHLLCLRLEKSFKLMTCKMLTKLLSVSQTISCAAHGCDILVDDATVM